MRDLEPVVEGPVRLSESRLWQLQGSFYEKAGVGAFATGEVPHLLTGSPLLARSYAAMIAAYVEDCVNGPKGSFNRDAPFYIVELGAGTGRLAFHLLRALGERHLPVRVVYVLTDLGRANVSFFRGHPSLAPFFEAGTLDVAQFDATRDDEIVLENSGKRLRHGVNPLVVIANYVFDVLPQDLFVRRVRGVDDALVSLTVADGVASFDSPGFLDRMRIAIATAPARPGRYVDDGFDDLLAETASLVPVGGRFLFPVEAMRAMRALFAISDGHAFVIAGERPGRPAPEDATTVGVATPSTSPAELLAMGVHGGTFSLPVDPNALRAFARDSGGVMLSSDAAVVGFAVHVLVIDRAGGDRSPRTADAFGAVIRSSGPEDLFLAMKAALDRDPAELPLPMLLSIIRLSGFDPYLFGRCYRGLEAAIATIDDEGGAELERVLGAVFRADFPLDEHLDLAYGIALLLAGASRFTAALTYFARSRARRGPSAEGAYNEALCFLHLGREAEARALLDESLGLDPTFAKAATLLTSIEE